MKNIVALILLSSFLLLISCEKSLEPQETQVAEVNLEMSMPEAGTPIENSYIVVFKNGTIETNNSVSLAKAAVQMHAANVLESIQVSEEAISNVYAKALPGFSARISKEQAETLKSDKRIAFIEQDMVMNKGPRWNDDPDDPPAGEVMPWGITRVGGGANYTGPFVAWIIDSGIDLDHPDLNVDASRGVEYIDRTDILDDDNGHGTHVAGTVAAIAGNDIGVVGVAAGATVIPVKVLDRRGSGSTTGVIAGVDWVAANGTPGDVANMSLGGGVSDALDLAVFNASQTGVLFSLAAGNESDDADTHSPGRTEGPNIFTISAFAEGDIWASFSNYGNPPVDYGAPGVAILSLAPGGGTATMNGTSMAVPHVAGLLLSTGGSLSTDGYVSGDPDGIPDPIAHQ